MSEDVSELFPLGSSSNHIFFRKKEERLDSVAGMKKDNLEMDQPQRPQKYKPRIRLEESNPQKSNPFSRIILLSLFQQPEEKYFRLEEEDIQDTQNRSSNSPNLSFLRKKM